MIHVSVQWSILRNNRAIYQTWYEFWSKCYDKALQIHMTMSKWTKNDWYCARRTFVITLSLAIQSRIRYQTPMSRTRCVTGRRWKVSSFFASNRISSMLFNKAKNGANGKAATKIVTKPYCRTEWRMKNIYQPVPSIISSYIQQW